MNRYRHLLLFCAALAFGPSALAAKEVDAGEKAALQAAMRQHVDRQLVHGSFLDMDLASGAVRKLHPVTAHPVLLRMGAYYVLCTDFRDSEGKPVNIDFYMARRGKSYAVFRTEVNNHAALDRLISAGKVERLE